MIPNHKRSDSLDAPFVYLSGIGGTGMSALAGILKYGGIYIQGSDSNESIITERLRQLGIKVLVPQHASNVTSLPQLPNLVIRSPAVLNTVPEIQEFIKQGVPILAYHQGLGLITPSFKTIGIAGTHGKTSTTAILSKILLTAQIPFVGLVGAIYKEFNNTNFYIHPRIKLNITNTINQLNLKETLPPVDKPITEFASFPTEQTNHLFVIEADEYKKAILNHRFYILALVGIDYDHADYYKTPKEYLGVFARAILNTYGYAVLNLASSNQKRILEIAKTLAEQEKKSLPKIVDWSKHINTIRNLDIYLKTRFLIEDSAVAYTVAKLLAIPEHSITQGIELYRGIWRRFEIKGTLFNGKTTVISDYAHNPQKIEYALEALQSYITTNKLTKVLIIFQAHQYYRLFSLKEEFIKVFLKFLQSVYRRNIVPTLWITDIYDARSPDEHKNLINAEIFTQDLKIVLPNALRNQVQYTGDISDTAIKLQTLDSKPPEVILLLSAGNLENILPKQ